MSVVFLNSDVMPNLNVTMLISYAMIGPFCSIEVGAIMINTMSVVETDCTVSVGLSDGTKMNAIS